MPSGKAHDAITIVLAAPAVALSFAFAGDAWYAALVGAGFLFGGLMFGPDLDTISKQYARWRVLRVLWFPYRSFFKHRSRWSHGLIFGTLLRVVYFMGVATCLAFVLTYAYGTYQGGELPGIWSFTQAWARLRAHTDAVIGPYGAVALFVGMWIGAASHTVTDLAGTYIKTGRAKV